MTLETLYDLLLTQKADTDKQFGGLREELAAQRGELAAQRAELAAQKAGSEKRDNDLFEAVASLKQAVELYSKNTDARLAVIDGRLGNIEIRLQQSDGRHARLESRVEVLEMTLLRPRTDEDRPKT